MHSRLSVHVSGVSRFGGRLGTKGSGGRSHSGLESQCGCGSEDSSRQIYTHNPQLTNVFSKQYRTLIK